MGLESSKNESSGAAMEAASEEESKDKYQPPNLAEYSDHYYSTNAPHPDLVRACEDDDGEQVRQAVNSGTATEPVIRPDLMEEVPESYFQNVHRSHRIPMTIMTLLILAACYYGSIHCVQFLLWCDPSLLHGKVMFNRLSQPRAFCNPASLLHVCAFRGHKALCELLIKNGVDVNVQDEFGRTPLHFAASGGHVGVLEWLLNAGYPLEAKDSRRHTLLHCAALGGHVSVAEYLLNSGHSLDPKDNVSQDIPGASFWADFVLND
ncbi:serine/threonine-protein phosphatase 6 regulatory ankyrin repeat subunit C-like [Sycon ciliatum]|uniref:serine/threonine-protein phosphatase 6 regulatory ankyrin repeat subunit C-like n=1 Tax=Sycon ciliatum TaxID=27933 RepID=UPI0031F70D1D